MRVPGSNLLSVAMRVINPQTVQWRAFEGRTKNSRASYVDGYAPAVDVFAAVQPVPRALYQQLGLDLSKSYWTIWVQPDVRVLNRDTTGDLVLYGTRTLKCESDTNWRESDGWRKILSIEVPGL